MKALVLILLLANLVLGLFISVAETQPTDRAQSSDLNAVRMRFLPLSQTSPLAPQVNAVAPDLTACLQWSGIAGADLPKARNLLAPLVPAERIVENRVEGPLRFAVYMPQADNAQALVTRLKDAGFNGSIQANNAISLGLFNTEENALRLLGQAKEKGFLQVKIERRDPQVKQGSLSIRGVSSEIVDRLNEWQGQFAGSSVRSIPCPGEEKAE